MSVRPVWRRHRLLGVLATISLIALAVLPAVPVTAAPAKLYEMNVTPSSAVAGTSTDFFVTITNKTPGNSNANSFSVTAPTGFNVTAASISSATNPNASATVTVVASSRVDVKFIDPVKSNQFVTVKITATTPSITGCNKEFTWSASVYTGNSLNGDTFGLVSTGNTPTTTVLSCLQLRFVSGFAPTDGGVGTDIHVQVEAVSGGSRVTSFTGEVTIEKVPGSGPGSLSGNVDTASGGLADFPNFQGDTAGDYNVIATSPGVSSSAPTSFSLFEGEITCGGDPVVEGSATVTWIVDPADPGLPGCAPGETKPASLSFTGKDLEFLTGDGPQATFEVSITAWDPEPQMAPVPFTEVEPPLPLSPGEWCEGTPDAPAMPANESWCLITQSTSIFGPDGDGGQLMQVTETWLLTADAGARRK